MSEIGRDVSFLTFIWGHCTLSFKAPSVDLSGRTILVTGGNAGLGYATVLHAARSNAERIIIASRNRSKCEAAAEQVHKEVPSFRGKVDIMIVDLSSFDSVKAFCNEVKADKGRLDIVVANAGMVHLKFSQTKDGWEEILQVNDLSTGLMGLLLLPKLVETAKLPVPEGSPDLKPHLTIVASEVHYWAKFPQQNVSGPLLDALNDPAQFSDGNERYNVSKMLNLFMAREIAKLPAVTSGSVAVNSVNPGLCKSAFRDDFGPVLASIMNYLSWSAEYGSQSIFYAATQTTSPGAYISACTETPPSSFVVSSKGREMQEKYWKEALELWQKLAPEVVESSRVQ